MTGGLTDLRQVAGLVPRMSDPLLGVLGGMGVAYLLTRPEREKWNPFWLALAAAFVANRLSAMVDVYGRPIAPTTGVSP